MTQGKKDEIVLVAPGPERIQMGANAHLPLAILSLAAWLREKGNFNGHIKILDTQIHKATSSDFSDAAIIGISAMTGIQVKYGLRVAAIARASNPKAVIVWGGIHPSLLPEQTAQHWMVDVVIAGEGEETFLEVVRAVLGNNELVGIPGTFVRNNRGEIVASPKRPFLDLDEMPLPAYDLIDINEYDGIKYQFDYQSSRGCPFKCAFCYNTVFCSRRWRKKSPEKVVRELSLLHEKYNVVNFGLVDDEFFIDRKRSEAIFDGIIKSGSHFGIIASCRLDMVRRYSASLLGKMKAAGVTQLFFGAESGSDRMLKVIQKDITTDDIIKGAEAVAEAGIRPILSFMSGFPEETIEDFDQTIEMILKLWSLHPLITVNGIFPFNPYPGTNLYRKSIDLGLKAPSSLEQWGDWNFQYKPNNSWLTAEMKQRMQISFYMVRFMYYLARYEDRYKGRIVVRMLMILTQPIISLIKLRMRKRWFGMAGEWRIFASIVAKTFGYL